MIGAFAGANGVDVAVQDRHQADFGHRLQNQVQRRVAQTCRVSGNLRGHELLVHAEFADAGEHPREGEQDPADVIGGIHVGGVEAGDHRVDARLLVVAEREVLRGDDGVDERVVVERGVREQVVVRRPVAGDEVVPLLLKRDAEHGDPSDATADDLEVLAGVEPPLDVVREVEVDIVEQRHRHDSVDRLGGIASSAVLAGRIGVVDGPTRQKQSDARRHQASAHARRGSITSRHTSHLTLLPGILRLAQADWPASAVVPISFRYAALAPRIRRSTRRRAVSRYRCRRSRGSRLPAG